MRVSLAVLGMVWVLVALPFAETAWAVDPAPPPPGPKDRCGVCGMYVAKYPQWIASVRFTDGTVVFFDGPKDLFRYLLDLETFKPGATAEQVAAVFVTDYYSTRAIDGRTASYVIGSDVMGPMGAELVPTADAGHAETLLKDHAGERIVSFGEVTAELVKP
jgi:nitrous oxide reductase accessory protein NosL